MGGNSDAPSAGNGVAAGLSPTVRVHVVGVGGAGMSALAWLLLERGHDVSGSDLRAGRAITALRAMGAEISIGHHPAAVERSDLVVASPAIPGSDAELRRARELGRPVLARTDLLDALMADHDRVLVAGTHGKTTVASMITVCMHNATMDPSFVVGGTLHDTGTSAHHGTGRWFVAEADEHDDALVTYAADIAVVTGLRSRDALGHGTVDPGDRTRDQAVTTFLARRRAGGTAVLCLDDDGVRRMLPRVAAPVDTYGRHPDATLRVVEVDLEPQGARFGLVHRGEHVGRFEIALPGDHNVINAAAAALVSVRAGVEWDAVRRGLSIFAGASRRFERLGVAAGVTVVDDYGHHPTELAATLAAARQATPDGRVIVVFQPHRFSWTATLHAELGAALAAADTVVVTDVYGAGEQPVAGVTGELVAAAAMRAGGAASYVPSVADVADRVLDLSAPGDLIMTLGAGDITEVGPVVLRRLRGVRG